MKSVKNFRYVEKTSVECNEDSYLVILHLSRVELHCKLQEKLHRVTWPLGMIHLPSISTKSTKACSFDWHYLHWQRQFIYLLGLYLPEYNRQSFGYNTEFIT